MQESPPLEPSMTQESPVELSKVSLWKRITLFTNRVAPRFFFTIGLLVCLIVLVFSYLTLSELESVVSQEANKSLAQVAEFGQSHIESKINQIRADMDRIWFTSASLQTPSSRRDILDEQTLRALVTSNAGNFTSISILEESDVHSLVDRAQVNLKSGCLPTKTQASTRDWITARIKTDKKTPTEMIRVMGISPSDGSSKCLEVSREMPIESAAGAHHKLWMVAAIESDRLAPPDSPIGRIYYFDRSGKAFRNLPHLGQEGFATMPAHRMLKKFALDRTPSLVDVGSNNNQDQLTAYSFSRLDKLDNLICLATAKPSMILSTLAQMRHDFSLTSIIIGLLTILMAFELARRIASPIRKITDITRLIAAGAFDIRAPQSNLTEITQLGESINSMALTIRDLLKRQHHAGRMSAELDAARTMQGMILPQTHEDYGFFHTWSFNRSATECGGDLWGVIPTGDGRFVVYIGDATGHGVASAFVAVAAYATFCTIRGASLTLGVQKPDTAAALLSILNKTIFDTGHGEILMTMLLLVIDPATSTISLANAAHPFLLHLKKEGDDALYQAEFRGVPGDLLGMSETWQGETLQITVQPHDLIAIYTDGITENPNHENKRLSNRKLREFVAAMANAKEEPLDQKLQEWYERFLGEVVLKDDSTMVLLTFDHQSEKGALQKKSAA